MNAPLRRAAALPPALALALHTLAVYCGTVKARASLALWRSDAAPLAYLGAWLTPDLFFALAADDGAPSLDLAASTLRGRGYTTQGETPAKLSRALADALGASRGDHISVSAPAVGVYADCLPAVVTHARFNAPKLSSRAVDATALRAIFAGPWDLECEVYRTAAPSPSGQTVGVLLIVGHGWRAMLRSRAANEIIPEPPTFRETTPAALVCSVCGATGGYYATELDLFTGARRRRWRQYETDEGTVHRCARCNAAVTDDDDEAQS